jgi:hypothetical protein
MKRSIIISIVLLLVILLIGCSKNQTFNDTKSMETKIAKELNTKEVSAFGLHDIDKYRFVGYTFDNHYGFAIFKLNENGDYIFERVKKADKMIPRALGIVVDYHNDYWIAISNNENLNTIQFKTKDKSNSNDKIITVEVTDCPSISVIKLPYEDYFESGEYNFYDDKSNLIK